MKKLMAERKLRPRLLPNGDKYGLEQYISFTEGNRPGWWTDSLEEEFWNILGLYENYPNMSNEAVLVSTDTLIVLRDTGSDTLRYENISDFIIPSKEPLSKVLILILKNNTAFNIPIRDSASAGDIMLFLRFILQAVYEINRRK